MPSKAAHYLFFSMLVYHLAASAVNHYWKVSLLALSFFAALFFAAPSFVFATPGNACSPSLPCGFGEACDAGTGKCVMNFGMTEIQSGLGGSLGQKPLIETITSLINVALGLLGGIAVVIILIGGFKWMTAGGNEDKVAESRKMIFAGIIGLAIILSAWAIAKFVITSLSQATGSGNVS